MQPIETAVDFLRTQPVVTLFLVLGCGYLLGRVRIAGFSLGALAGTLLIALALGRYGFRISAAAQSVGFALFIFSVGYQAGPHFVEVLKTQGLRYLTLSAFVAAVGYFTAVLADMLLDLPGGAAAGLFAGALTTTPALAAAQEAVRSGIAVVPAGLNQEQLISNIGTSYAITYIVGMLGVIAAVRLLPRFAGIDLAQEAQKLEIAATRDSTVQMQARAYRVASPKSCDVPLGELVQKYWDGIAVVRLRRGEHWLDAQATDRLQIDDEIHAYGDAKFFHGGIDHVGPEIPVVAEANLSAVATRVVIARREVLDRTLAELDLARKYGLVVTEARRDGLALPLTRELKLGRGDVLSVVGPKASIEALTEFLGPVEPNAAETDMSTFAFGIAIGSAIGVFTLDIAGVPIGLGAAGGLLLTGIITGWWNSNRPTVGKFPEPARWILMEFGLLIFMCGVGLQAGGEIVTAFQHAGPALLVAALAVVTLPIFGGYVFGRKVLGLPPVQLLGAICGAMTSGPALSLLTSEAKSTVPVLGYTGTYVFANLLLTFAGTLMMMR